VNGRDKDSNLLEVFSQFSSRSEAGTTTTAPRKILNRNDLPVVLTCKSRASTHLFRLSAMLLPYHRSVSRASSDLTVDHSPMIASVTKVDNRGATSRTVQLETLQLKELSREQCNRRNSVIRRSTDLVETHSSNHVTQF